MNEKCFVYVLPKELIQYILNQIIINYFHEHYLRKSKQEDTILYITTEKKVMYSCYDKAAHWAMVHILKQLSLIHPVLRKILTQHIGF